MTTSFTAAGHRWRSSLKFVGGEEKKKRNRQRKKEGKEEGRRQAWRGGGKNIKKWKRGTTLRKYNMQSNKLPTAPVSVMHPQTLGNSGGKA
jgi:hypothetical protein